MNSNDCKSDLERFRTPVSALIDRMQQEHLRLDWLVVAVGLHRSVIGVTMVCGSSEKNWPEPELIGRIVDPFTFRGLVFDATGRGASGLKPGTSVINIFDHLSPIIFLISHNHPSTPSSIHIRSQYFHTLSTHYLRLAQGHTTQDYLSETITKHKTQSQASVSSLNKPDCVQ